ncbi:hypothetical protein [Sphingobium subterraneum]|nr:hypothetical protein [Sphingobium subterraneum]
MPGAALLQAISRLDQAIAHAESACADALDARATPPAPDSSTRDASVRRALAQLDSLISDLKAAENG